MIQYEFGRCKPLTEGQYCLSALPCGAGARRQSIPISIIPLGYYILQGFFVWFIYCNCLFCRCQDDLDRAPAEFTRARLEDVQALVFFDQNAMALRGQRGPLNKFFLMYQCHEMVGPLLQRVLPFLYKSPNSIGPPHADRFYASDLQGMHTTWAAMHCIGGAVVLGAAFTAARCFFRSKAQVKRLKQKGWGPSARMFTDRQTLDQQLQSSFVLLQDKPVLVVNCVPEVNYSQLRWSTT